MDNNDIINCLIEMVIKITDFNRIIIDKKYFPAMDYNDISIDVKEKYRISTRHNPNGEYTNILYQDNNYLSKPPLCISIANGCGISKQDFYKIFKYKLQEYKYGR